MLKLFFYSYTVFFYFVPLYGQDMQSEGERLLTSKTWTVTKLSNENSSYFNQGDTFKFDKNKRFTYTSDGKIMTGRWVFSREELIMIFDIGDSYNEGQKVPTRMKIEELSANLLVVHYAMDKKGRAWLK